MQAFDPVAEASRPQMGSAAPAPRASAEPAAAEPAPEQLPQEEAPPVVALTSARPSPLAGAAADTQGGVERAAQSQRRALVPAAPCAAAVLTSNGVPLMRIARGAAAGWQES